MKKAVIVFTKVPSEVGVKTRMKPKLKDYQCKELQECFIKDIGLTLHSHRRELKSDFDIIFYITPYSRASIFNIRLLVGSEAKIKEQVGDCIGTRMKNAIEETLSQGYESAVLIGSDIPDLPVWAIGSAFEALECHDLVIAPTEDGGYYLIGMKTLVGQAFNIGEYGGANVFESTVGALAHEAVNYIAIPQWPDVDLYEDLAPLRSRIMSAVENKTTAPIHTLEYLNRLKVKNENISWIGKALRKIHKIK